MKKSKYKIDGVPLNIYCEEHNLNFHVQSNRVREYIKAHPELTQDEAAKLAMSRCGIHPGTKYMYDNKSLSAWCEENNENYFKMISRVESIKSTNPTISDSEATRMAIEDFNDNGIIYYYDGIPLVEYCRLHPEYNYGSVLSHIRRARKKYPHLSVQLIINSYFEKEHKSHNSYFVDEMPLKEYCIVNNLSYRYIIYLLYSMRIKEEYKNLDIKERLEIAVNKAREKLKQEQFDKVFIYLRKVDEVEDDLLPSILEYLKIDYQNAINLCGLFPSMARTILFIWFFYDKEINGYISATEKRVEEIFSLMNNLPIDKENIMGIDLYLLIALYKANLMDTRYLIMLHQDDFTNYSLLEVLKKYDLYLEDYEKEELIEDANKFMLKIIDKNNINNSGMFVSYVTKSVKFRFVEKVPVYLKSRDNISIYSQDYKSGMLYLLDNNSMEKEEVFVSEQVREVILSLDKMSRHFIRLKYYEGLSDMEIARVLNMTIKELRNFENRLLANLSKRESLKQLILGGVSIE